MRRFLLIITLVFVIKSAESIQIRWHRHNPRYLLGQGVPSRLTHVLNYLQLVGGRSGSKQEYPIDFKSLLKPLENKVNQGTLGKAELNFISEAAGISCSHGANFTVDPHPEQKGECHAITCFCIRKNSYLCSYESSCAVLLSTLSQKEQKITEEEYENVDDNDTNGEEITVNEYEDEGVEDKEKEETDYNGEQEEEIDDDDEENQDEDSEQYEDEGAFEVEEEEEERVEGEKNVLLCEQGSIHRLNNFHIPPCMICLCLDKWTMFCATKSMKQCLSDNNRDINGQIINNERDEETTGYGMINDVDVLKSALDEVAALKEWTETKKLYGDIK